MIEIKNESWYPVQYIKLTFFLTCFKIHNNGHLIPSIQYFRKCYDMLLNECRKETLTKLKFMILIEHKFREKQAIIENLLLHTVCKQNKVFLSFLNRVMQVLVCERQCLGEKRDEFALQHKNMYISGITIQKSEIWQRLIKNKLILGKNCR